MKTPYDTALRVAERRLDQVRATMAKVTGYLRLLEQEEDAAAAALERECRLASDDPRLTTERYFGRARDRRVKLGALRAASQAELEALRQKVVTHYAERIAIETAITRYREEAERTAAAAEQAAIDDLSAGRYRRPVRRHAPTRASTT